MRVSELRVSRCSQSSSKMLMTLHCACLATDLIRFTSAASRASAEGRGRGITGMRCASLGTRAAAEEANPRAALDSTGSLFPAAPWPAAPPFPLAASQGSAEVLWIASAATAANFALAAAACARTSILALRAADFSRSFLARRLAACCWRLRCFALVT